MKFRALDVSGDWMYGQGIGSYAQNEDEIALDIATRCRSWYGNCVFDPQAGVDWPHRLDKNQVKNLVEELTTVIYGTSGVVRVNSVVPRPDPVTRTCPITVNVDTIFNKNFQVEIAALASQPTSVPPIPST